MWPTLWHLPLTYPCTSMLLFPVHFLRGVEHLHTDPGSLYLLCKNLFGAVKIKYFLCFSVSPLTCSLVHSGKENTMSDRFDCRNCNESLYGRKYIQVEEKPHCIPCYDRLYANTCQECKEIIGHNAKVRTEQWCLSAHTSTPVINQMN